jgi:hypothetical protein
MPKTLLIYLVYFIAVNAFGQDTFRRHPTNPRCFLYKGRPIVLVTATEHYGAVLNRQFDYIPYFDELARNALNLSRTFTFYRELEDSIPPLGYTNTLAPRPGQEAMPWKRTGPGKANDGGLKFDLSQWDPAYFTRMKHFLKAAAEREVVVEIVLFCNPYRPTIWSWFPMHPQNNVNGAGGEITEVNQFMELHDPTIAEAQKQFVRKMVQELNEFDNIYFEICNETAARNNDPEIARRQDAWHLALSRIVRETEQNLPKKHLIAINAHQRLPAYDDRGLRYTEIGDAPYFNEPLVDIINYHYISRKTPGKATAALETAGTRFGNILTFMEARRHVSKPLVFDENYSGVIHGAADEWDRNRLEAWETILSGGAGFDHLDWSFTPDDSTGSGKAPIPDGRRLDARRFRQQLGVLARLWKECGPDRMAPNLKLISSVPNHASAVASSHDDGQVHVIYVADARLKDGGFGDAVQGSITLRLPPGEYDAQVLPSGATEWRPAALLRAGREEMYLPLPEFRYDCAVVVRRRRS